MRNDRSWQWFKHGKQVDLRCNAISADGKAAKPAITLFVEFNADACRLAIEELKKYGYSNVTVDKAVYHSKD